MLEQHGIAEAIETAVRPTADDPSPRAEHDFAHRVPGRRRMRAAPLRRDLRIREELRGELGAKSVEVNALIGSMATCYPPDIEQAALVSAFRDHGIEPEVGPQKSPIHDGRSRSAQSWRAGFAAGMMAHLLAAGVLVWR